MIDAFLALPRCPPWTQPSPYLRFEEAWQRNAGSGAAIGLLDTSFDTQIPDLEGADLHARNFTGSPVGPSAEEHGSHSVSLLVGQGRRQIRGIVPKARLYVATVVADDGIARPGAVADAIDWLSCRGARIVIAPLGDAAEDQQIAQAITSAASRKSVFFAAAGNTHPAPLLFPAMHPLAIAVGAADSHLNLLSDCCRQPRLDLIAPGWDIAALVRHEMICRRSGSSVACVVAGAIAALAFSAGAIEEDSFSRTRVLKALTGN
jgi:subtilisin family serine protease